MGYDTHIVISDLDPLTFRRRPLYILVFASPQAAVSFWSAQSAAHGPAWTWTSSTSSTTSSPLPPTAQPSFSIPPPLASTLLEQARLRDELNCADGSGVLLTMADFGGGSKKTGRLPRTSEVRQALEERKIELPDEVAGRAVVRRVLTREEERVGWWNGLGAEGRWIVTCADPNEAQRAVREMHRRQLWPGGGRFRAEVIY